MYTKNEVKKLLLKQKKICADVVGLSWGSHVLNTVINAPDLQLVNKNDLSPDVSGSCIHLAVKNVTDAGSCNFCNRPHRKVNVVTGESFIEVRFCNKCLKELGNYR